MENTPNTFVNPMPHAMRNGFSVGLLFSANFLLSTSNNAFVQALTYAAIVMIAVFAWKAACDFRDREAEGIISFYRVFSYIFLLFFFASLISALVKLVYLKYINTDYLSQLLDSTLKFVEQAKITIPEGSEDALKSMLSPISFTMNTVMADMLIGAVIGLCYAPFIKKQNS